MRALFSCDIPCALKTENRAVHFAVELSAGTSRKHRECSASRSEVCGREGSGGGEGGMLRCEKDLENYRGGGKLTCI